MLQFSLRMRPTAKRAFQQIVWAYYEQSGRHYLPWRQPEENGGFDPYKILVSELMLQQTQVARVMPKYIALIQAYPTFAALARAPLSQVLIMWNGLGYNRRAKFLWQAAQIIAKDYNGHLPQTKESLVALPGVGPSTAGAVLAYAYNRPEVFIETNVRTVLLHHFFKGQAKVLDSALVPVMQATLPQGKTRLWYWALMDYGTWLKQTTGNMSRASAHYARQPAFTGSRRQIRGQVLRFLAVSPQTLAGLSAHISDARLQSVLADLMTEGFLEQDGSHYRLHS